MESEAVNDSVSDALRKAGVNLGITSLEDISNLAPAAQAAIDFAKRMTLGYQLPEHFKIPSPLTNFVDLFGLNGIGKIDSAVQNFSSQFGAITSATVNIKSLLGGYSSNPYADFLATQQRALKDLYSPLHDAARRIWEEKQTEDRLRIPLAERGWILYPLMNLEVLRDLEAAANENPTRADEMLTEYFEANFDRLMSELLDYAVSKPWEQKFERAYEAHKRGEYDLAVPIWLIAIDGIARKAADNDKFDLYSNAQSVTGYSKIISKLNVGKFATKEALIQALFLMSRGSANHTEGIGLNRHIILHGLNPNFGDKRESLQAMNTLFALGMLCELKKTDSAD